MKQKTIWLLFWCAVSASTMAQSYPSVDSLNSYINSTIKDKRPAKVTVDDMRNAFLGISGFLSNTPIRKFGNGLTLQNDSLFLGGTYTNLVLSSDQNGYSSSIVSLPGDFELYANSPFGESGSYVLSSNGVHTWYTAHGSQYQMTLSTDSLCLRDDGSFQRPFVFYRNGNARLGNFRNASSAIAYLSTDADGLLKLQPLKTGPGLKAAKDSLYLDANSSGTTLSNQQGEYSSSITYPAGDIYLNVSRPDAEGTYEITQDGIHYWVASNGKYARMVFTSDSLFIQDIAAINPFAFYTNGNLRLDYFKNITPGINYLSTDASGFVKLTPLKLGSGLKYQQNTLDLTSNNQFQVLQYTSATTWDISNGVNAQLSLAGNATLTITNAAAGQQGVLIATTSVAGSSITFPANSYQLKSDGYDSGNLNPISDNTKVGKNADGSNATGTWLCSFLYDGTNYYWTIKRAS